MLVVNMSVPNDATLSIIHVFTPAKNHLYVTFQTARTKPLANIIWCTIYVVTAMKNNLRVQKNVPRQVLLVLIAPNTKVI